MRNVWVLAGMAVGAMSAAGCSSDGERLIAPWQCSVVDGAGTVYRSSDFDAVAAMSTATAECAENAHDPTLCVPQGCAKSN